MCSIEMVGIPALPKSHFVKYWSYKVLTVEQRYAKSKVSQDKAQIKMHHNEPSSLYNLNSNTF